MPTIRISPEQYQALVQAFREKPGNVARAARIAKVTEPTAKRCWDRGYERPIWAQRPIKQLLEDEQIAARAKIEAERIMRQQIENDIANDQQATYASMTLQNAKDRELAKRDAADQRAKEAQAVRAAMTHGSAIMSIAGSLGAALIPVVQRVSMDIRGEDKMKWREVVELVTKIAWLGQSGTNVVGKAMELERLRLGKPEQIIGIENTAQATQVDVDRAVELLGDEAEVRAAIKELADGSMTERVLKLLEAGPRLPGDDVH